MTKDRLDELKQGVSNSNTKNKRSPKRYQTPYIKPNNDVNKKKLLIVKQIQELVATIEKCLQHLEKNTEEAHRYLKEITENYQYNLKRLDKILERIFQNNTTLAKEITSKLKQLQKETNLLEKSSAEGRIATVQCTTLKTRFSANFQQSVDTLEKWRTIQKNVLKAQLRTKGGRPQADDELLTKLLENSENLYGIFTENIIVDTMEAKRLLADVEERHQQLVQIEKMLVEVRDLFVQMAVLVENQQEIVNSVEYQAQLTTDYVEKVDLQKVHKSKKKYLRRKLYFIGVLAILIMILLIVLFK